MIQRVCDDKGQAIVEEINKRLRQQTGGPSKFCLSGSRMIEYLWHRRKQPGSLLGRIHQQIYEQSRRLLID